MVATQAIVGGLVVLLLTQVMTTQTICIGHISVLGDIRPARRKGAHPDGAGGQQQ
jgi:hypothetical protein